VGDVGGQVGVGQTLTGPEGQRRHRRRGQVELVEGPAGVERSQAEEALSTAGLKVGAISEQTDTGTPPGTVISQDPAAGTSIDSATPVDLVVAASNATVTVPSVTCVPVNLAATQLAQAGLQMTVAGTEANDLCPATGGPRVARQEPVGDQSVPSSTVIKVWTTLPLPSASPTGGGGGSPKPSP
jgi:serine/threonine-protein kinase